MMFCASRYDFRKLGNFRNFQTGKVGKILRSIPIYGSIGAYSSSKIINIQNQQISTDFNFWTIKTGFTLEMSDTVIFELLICHLGE